MPSLLFRIGCSTLLSRLFSSDSCQFLGQPAGRSASPAGRQSGSRQEHKCYERSQTPKGYVLRMRGYTCLYDACKCCCEASHAIYVGRTKSPCRSCILMPTKCIPSELTDVSLGSTLFSIWAPWWDRSAHDFAQCCMRRRTGQKAGRLPAAGRFACYLGQRKVGLIVDIAHDTQNLRRVGLTRTRHHPLLAKVHVSCKCDADCCNICISCMY